ncbi:Ask10p KNAG_0B01080 [Huiozyma naganishii CBS 8797]|uniref:PH domain-containing protein n=1 Tax=Huiozyma naganishii (strain ATCC MYA-139 / BCRC 22969 / CBS 8797 / KCTC 17520 / NBRC 10181 / NCYC 3082 / Yp74L-3) TaxID=1071383 RepID=J7R183_HUIN7|nr:hypothetical protein KNAG_0B01080 [Kazachstania naganishii CBS 8797]CCK68555.1 hypothetical protein KNAG_0B01080 [Kazachstania naganishii CBS 8797]
MSDYFSVKPIPPENALGGESFSNVSTPNQLSPNYGVRRVSKPGNNSQDDFHSVHSSQYLIDMLPDSLTLKDNQTSSHLSANKDYILPKTNERSPYYVGVPVPNPLAVSQNTMQEAGADDEAESYYVREYPTDILMDRFHKWKKVLKGLSNYLREVAYSEEQFARIHLQLKASIKFPFLTDLEEGTNKLIDPLTTAKPIKKQQPKTLAQQKAAAASSSTIPDDAPNMYGTEFESESRLPNAPFAANYNGKENTEVLAASGFMKFGSGSVQDLQVVLKKHHVAMANQQLKISKEISTTVIPKLDSLRKDLNFKIKEIKDLHGDFKTNIKTHLMLTQKLLGKYIASVKFMSTQSSAQTNPDSIHLHPKHDPYLLKLQLDLQLKRQIAEENYLREAFINLQSSGMKLEKIIYGKLQHALQRYSALMDSEARLMIKNLCHELQQGLLTKPPAVEWDHFVSHHPSCLLDLKSNDPIPPLRKLSDIVYPNMKCSVAKCIRAGYFYKKSNYAKNYTKGYFVLTPNYLHEFESSHFYETIGKQPVNSTRAGSHLPASSGVSSTAQNQTTTTTSASGSGIHTASLTPTLSIPLNDCTLSKGSEHHFTLTGRVLFNEGRILTKATKRASVPNNHGSSIQSLSSASLNPALHNSAKMVYDAPKSVLGKKIPFKKLLNPAKSRYTKHEEQQRKIELKEANLLKEQEAKNVVTWTFKLVSDEPSEEELRHFKKWVQDLKSLCAFNTTPERVKFIEDRVLKLQQGKQPRAIRSTSGSSVPTLNEYNGPRHSVDASSSTVHLMDMNIRQNQTRPQYISIQNSPITLPESSFRTKINTPAIDDNGNLITMEGRSYYANPVSMNPTPTVSPSHSSTSENTYVAGLLPQQLTQQLNQLNQQPKLQPMSTTPTGSSMTNAPTRQRHQRNVSLPTSLKSVHSPGSLQSEGSGYFGIPVARSSNENLPLVGITPPLSRTTSRGTSITTPSVNRVPVVKVNNEEVKEARPTLTERSSTGSLPSSATTMATDLYQRNNSSATNLTTSRVHPIRKHKKNVSFSSLNSLMFAKKGASSNFNGNQIMNGGIREDDDGSSIEHNVKHNDDKVKLNQSIYS